MIISTDARIIQYPFIIKTLSDLGMERNSLTNKEYQKPTGISFSIVNECFKLFL